MIPKKRFLNLTPDLLVKAIIWTNVIMFLASLLFSGKNIRMTLNPFHAFTPSTEALSFLGASGRFPITQFKSWWSLITANWLHGGLLHILFNMMALKTVAPLVIKEFGMSRMFSIYTLAGAAGFLFSYFGNVFLTIGASSGLCGLIGAAWYYGRSRGGQWGHLIYKQTSGWVLSLALIGFLLPNINNWSHAGGLVAGIFLGWLLGYTEKRPVHLLDVVLAVFLTLLTIWLLAGSIIEGLILILS